MSDKPAFIHHVNFPTTDPERTIEWYSRVFGMKYIKPKSNTKVVLMTRGNFDLHFTPVEEMDRMAPYHFAVEVEDWDGFLAHLAELGIRHTRVITRPENNSQFCYIHDPDHTMIELVFHERRPYPPVPKKSAESAPAFPGNGVPGGAESAEQARAELSAAEGRLRVMAMALSGDARIYYEVNGSGPAVLFVHGSGGHHAAWWQQVAALSPDYTVITLDLRGFGNSRWESDHDARNFPGDIIAVLDAVAADGGPSSAVLVGQSIGAAAALRAALNRPDRVSGVILAHSLGGLRHDELTALVKADRAVAEQLPVLDRLLTPAFRAERPDLAFLFRQMGTFNTAKMQDLRNLNSAGPTVAELAAAPFPVLLLAGEKDAVLSPATVRRAGELLPSARVEVVTGAPHSMYWETPQLFNDAVARFLKDVAAV